MIEQPVEHKTLAQIRAEQFQLWREEVIASLARQRADRGESTRRLLEKWIEEDSPESYETLAYLIAVDKEKPEDERNFDL